MAIGNMRAGSAKDNSMRKHDGGGPRPDNTVYKRDEAAKRQAEWSKLTPEQQLASLDTRLGKGNGALKQRARLQTLIDAPKRRAMGATASQDKIEQLGKHGHDVSKLKAKDRRTQEQATRPNK